MPELPEVETVVRSLKDLCGQVVQSLTIYTPSIIKMEDFKPETVRGAVINSIFRRGKFIVLQLEPPGYIVFHLGMSGRVYLCVPKEPVLPHTHAVMTIKGGAWELRHVDPRRFGGIWLVESIDAVLSKLGPEPLGPELDLDYLLKELSRRKTAIKNLLLNQGFLAGIGNIYADEILHRAGIKPDRAANSLKYDEVKALEKSIRETLELGIYYRGTTFRDYRDGYNQTGAFQHHLRVYGREGQPCPVCGQPILKTVLGNRSSHFCDKCQY